MLDMVSQLRKQASYHKKAIEHYYSMVEARHSATVLFILLLICKELHVNYHLAAFDVKTIDY